MNLERIRKAANDIERNQIALKWLEEYAQYLTGKDGSFFEFTTSLAGGADGASQAREVIERFAILSLPDIVAASIQNCRNTIELCRTAIAEESAAP